MGITRPRPDGGVKKLEETNKIALETTINIRLHWCLRVYTLN